MRVAFAGDSVGGNGDGRRALPSGLGAPATDPDSPPGPADPAVGWLQPMPDALVIPETQDPAIVAAREGVRLALIASLQYLSARPATG
jgi:RNA polymerase sigma-70 factor, ECF subfamily